MNEIIIQTFIEKLELLEKSNENLAAVVKEVTNYNPILKEVSERIRTVQMEIRDIPAQISIPGQEIQAQCAAMLSLTEQLKRPLQQKTIHHIEPPHLLSSFLIGVIICLAVWLSVLYFKKPQPELIHSFPSIGTPTENILKENIPKPHKPKQQIIPVKNPLQDSATHAKKKIDSLYKILMDRYEQKQVDK